VPATATSPIPAVVPQEYDPAVPLDRLTPHPANPNQGDQSLIADLLDANGWVGAVLAQKSTGIMIDGEHRWRTAKAKQMPAIPVMWVDVDDDSRDRFLASLNESARRGRNDEAALITLLEGLAGTPRGLHGAAFDGDDLDSLIAGMNRGLELDGSPTGARYAEDPEAMDEREQRIAGYADRKQAGALVEMILVFTADDRAEVGALLDDARKILGDEEIRGADLVLRAVRVMGAVLAAPTAYPDLTALTRPLAAEPAAGA
jgi:ParB-like chromosome segregation protein Spo0J